GPGLVGRAAGGPRRLEGFQLDAEAPRAPRVDGQMVELLVPPPALGLVGGVPAQGKGPRLQHLVGRHHPHLLVKVVVCSHVVSFRWVGVALSVSPPCGRLASSPTGGAKRTAVKQGKRRVRRSCEQVCLTTAWPAPTGVLLPPPVGARTATAASGRNREL